MQTYEKKLAEAIADPQQFARDVMALVKQNEQYHDNRNWHSFISERNSCQTSHCWAGFGELLLNDASPTEIFTSEGTKDLIKRVLNLSKTAAEYWFGPEWSIEDLEEIVGVFCNPIQEVTKAWINTLNIRDAIILSCRPDLSLDWMFALSRSTELDVVIAIAESRYIKAPVVESLVKSNYRSVKLALTRNLSVSIELIRPLILDDILTVRMELARRSDLSPSDVLLLAKDETGMVKCTIAQSKLMTIEAALAIKDSMANILQLTYNPWQTLGRNEALPLEWRQEHFPKNFQI